MLGRHCTCLTRSVSLSFRSNFLSCMANKDAQQAFLYIKWTRPFKIDREGLGKSRTRTRQLPDQMTASFKVVGTKCLVYGWNLVSIHMKHACERFKLLSLRYADRLKNKTKQMLTLLLALSTISLLLFSLSCAGILPSTKPLLFSSIIFGGLFFNGAISLFIELTVECAYPVGEGLASSFNMTMTSLIGLFFYIPFMLPHSDVRWMNWVTVCSLRASVLGLLIYREKYTRLEIDERDVDGGGLRNTCEKHLVEAGFD